MNLAVAIVREQMGAVVGRSYRALIGNALNQAWAAAKVQRRPLHIESRTMMLPLPQRSPAVRLRITRGEPNLHEQHAWALARCRVLRSRFAELSRVTDISLATEHLTEPALKGLAYELRRCARLYVGERPYCEAAGAEAELRREIRARYRTGRGAWYACVRVMHWDEARSEAREIDCVEERCASKDAAIEKARALLAEHAHRFASDRTVEPEVFSELEWSTLKLLTEDDDAD
ncbi:hypothetical protein [Methylobacterium durans]|uniref:Uncharacterized protein n=1 Tax=Methylobacterium durans TaxID=2202825 RepID=A0A2U8WE39_9HYPH|nr:hypothetical protein [Methylobacterium durans]AWN43576.1 hypothetical protein DK389_27565 [Methylobacterium durans]